MTDATLFPSDISDAVKIIDYAAEQGAFRGWENIRQILVVRDRLHTFSESVLKAEEKAKSETATAADSASA
jgi:ferritin-like protein